MPRSLMTALPVNCGEGGNCLPMALGAPRYRKESEIDYKSHCCNIRHPNCVRHGVAGGQKKISVYTWESGNRSSTRRMKSRIICLFPHR